jgi:hypothetical protein
VGPHGRWLASALILALLGCGGSSGGEPGVPAGRQTGPCYSDGTCNAGLTCVAHVCTLKQVDGGRVPPPPDAGTTLATDAAFEPASHPRLPQVVHLGGAVLAVPKVQPIVYAADSSGAATTDFVSQLAQSSYWATTTAEYGVGPLQVLPAITLSAQPPATITDSTIQATITSNTTGAAPAWGPADPSTIYLMVLPTGTTGSLPDGSTCCHDFGGYHDEVSAGASRVPYAVSCSCAPPAGLGLTSLQLRTAAISHELVEAATNPFPMTDAAYAGTENADLIWTFVTGGELADMCALNPDQVTVLPGTSYVVQRSWSNAAAGNTSNPCVPAPAGPYFNSFPALTPLVLTAGGMPFLTQGVSIPLGQSKTIDVTLFSAAPTAGKWSVRAYTLEQVLNQTNSNLVLSLDRTTGANGDVLHLTLTPRAANPALGGEGFVLISQLGQPGSADFQTNLSMGLITN